jgi:inosine/xanthosine triphosphatase
MKKIIVASKNPVKINSVKKGFEKTFPKEEFVFQGVSVPSGVSDQPMSEKETLQGAINRSNNAKENFPDADFWVGIEGGLQEMNGEMECNAWIVISSKDLQGKSKTATFFLPKKIVELIHQGKELGEADDIVFGHSNSKQKMGSVGILTKGVIDREKYYVEAVVLALIPFLNKDIY